MKILVVTGIFPPDHGGPATYVPAISTALSRHHQIDGVITLSDGPYDDSALPFPVLRIPRQWPRVLRMVRTIALIRSKCTAVDVIYLNGLVFEGVIACKLLASRPIAVKVVGNLIWERARNRGNTDNLDEFQIRRQHPFWEFMKWLQSWYMRKADRVIVPSRYLATVVAKWGVPPDRIAVVYNSVDTSPGETGKGIEPDFDIVTVARLVPWKGVAELIDLACENGWSLRIVGDGPLRTELEERVIRLKSHSRVCFAGQVPGEQVANELRRGRIFVLNSTYEGLPHVVIEAITAGTPTIATAVGGTPETIRDGVDGYLVAPGDSAALGQRIQTLLADPELRKKMAKDGRKNLASKFSFPTMVERTESALHEISGLRKV
jgi:glycosyltransferase involved in cell wall biosynthesis